MTFSIPAGLDINSGVMPADTGVQAGGGGAAGGSVRGSGNLWNQTPTGGLQPAGTAADYVVATFSIPAGAFDAAGRTIDITAQGSFAATGNNKTVKLIVGATAPAVGAVISGGTTIATTGVVATNNLGWSLGASVIKVGAAGSNTQSTIHFSAQCGAAVSALANPTALTQPENATINVSVTINCATAATDAKLWNFQGQWFN